eukprot:snap_masked-scaffold_30-processed-gene-2.9-mRNA-1 protein AED:1.00 eAED:1.00 QI:0/0/0/0/1/1/2/0/69
MHELTQFVYAANFLCSIILEFSRIRKLVLVGKIKYLERMRLVIDWTTEKKRAFDELKEFLERNLVNYLG